jgi:Tat protein secretion system quality control protein TatD with DNase activity
MYDLEKLSRTCFLMMGLHPTYKENYLEELQHVRKKQRKGFYAIGEVN